MTYLGDAASLYMSSFLHQTTTLCLRTANASVLYMSSFLHQTTTTFGIVCNLSRCICLLSYIKPQHSENDTYTYSAVYVFFPTSNHNWEWLKKKKIMLYMSSFLHQTTTQHLNHNIMEGCICLLSYIKPQLYACRCLENGAVYVFFPTSNHNCGGSLPTKHLLYMSSFLHQTTTLGSE